MVDGRKEVEEVRGPVWLCLEEGCTLQTAAVAEQCVGNTRYVNRQQLGLQHGALRTTKGGDLAGSPGLTQRQPGGRRSWIWAGLSPRCGSTLRREPRDTGTAPRTHQVLPTSQSVRSIVRPMRESDRLQLAPRPGFSPALTEVGLTLAARKWYF